MEHFKKSELIYTLFNNASEGIVLADAKGIISLVNPAAANMFGYSPDELIGHAIETLVPDHLKNKHVGNREQFQGQTQPRPMGVGIDLFARAKDARLIPVEISLSPIIIQGERYTVAFIIDITVRKDIERSVLEKQSELERVAQALIATNEGLEKKVNDRTKVLQEAIRELEKSRSDLSAALEKEKDLNDLKSRFISMASHEFRTPLTTILSSAGLIAEYNAGEMHADRRLKHLDRIRNAVNNLNDILSDFLSLSKLEEGKIRAEYTEFNLPDLVREVIGDLQVNTKAGQQIVYAHKGRERVVLDPKLLKNILINLVSNAIKFSPEQKPIRINTEAFDLTIRLEVADEGIGISEEDQKHLFERFYRGKNAFNIQGTGLGLNIVGNYVDLLKAHITLASQLDAGTTIKITFPHLIS
jgi:PAS domain S-box-containing protein